MFDIADMQSIIILVILILSLIFQTWCELALPKYYQYQYLRDNDPHAPGPAR